MIATRGYGNNASLITRGFGLQIVYEVLILSSIIHLQLIKNSFLHVGHVLLSSSINLLYEVRSQIKMPETIKSIIKTLRQFFSSIDTQKELDSEIDLTRKMGSKIDPLEK